MIYTSFDEFFAACEKACAASIVDPAAHKKDATFFVGTLKRGHYLTVGETGWLLCYDGINIQGIRHIASPLANFQAAVVRLRDE